MASGTVIETLLQERRILCLALCSLLGVELLCEDETPRREPATAGDVCRAGQVAGQQDALPGPLLFGVRQWNRRQQRLSVGM